VRFFKVLLLTVLCLVVLVSVVALQGLLLVNRTVLSTTFWETKILDPAVDAAMRLLEDQMAQGLGDLPQSETVASGMKAALTPEFVKASAGDVIDRVIGFLKGQYEDPFVDIDLVPQKQVFVDTVMGRLSDAEISGLRQQIQASPELSNEEVILSLLPVPDQISVAKFARANMGPELNELLTTVATAQGYRGGATLVGAVVLIVVLLLIWALAGLSGAFRWTGLTLILGSGVFLTASQADKVLRALPSTQLPAEVSEYISLDGLVQSVTATVMQVSTTIAIGFLGAGVLLLILGFILSSRKKRPSES